VLALHMRLAVVVIFAVVRPAEWHTRPVVALRPHHPTIQVVRVRFSGMAIQCLAEKQRVPET